jgi:hypothetical protein
MAKTRRDRLKRQPSSSAAARTVKGKTVASPFAAPRSSRDRHEQRRGDQNERFGDEEGQTRFIRASNGKY